MTKLSLAAARVNRGLSQKEAAKALKVSNKTLWKWEKGQAMPKADKIDAICDLYAIPYNNLKFYDTENA